ncbi:MAG: folylpolyglutamate synthase/dihydrofolate synthase family protein [Actinomycetota bacterium]|nr:folylpolyglutamate synthase/dihydrofolate synthase family protein [Actinomycetota bacterium]
MSIDFDQALSYLNSFGYNEINPGLERIEALLFELGSPHRGYDAIQVTGTNGKTSTSRILSLLLSAHGLKTGLFTSPHLISPTERYEISGEEIDKETFHKAVFYLKPYVERLNERIYPDSLSYFELSTALAFLIFKEAEVDLAVLEVGMGGRWDATSVCRPKVSVITNVALDHTDRLGDTVAEIAFEKAHIIKEGSLALVGDLCPQARPVIEERTRKEGSKLKALGEDFFLVATASAFSVKGLYGNYEDLKTSLLGEHQMKNAALALVAAEATLNRALDIELTKRVLKDARSPGRLEIVSVNPTIIFDGAHNPAGAKELVKSLKSGFKYDKLEFILAILDDKDVEGILSELALLDASFILTKNNNQRSAQPERLARSLRKREVLFAQDVESAIEMALARSASSDVICVTGSLSTVAEAKAAIRKGGSFGKQSRSFDQG